MTRNLLPLRNITLSPSFLIEVLNASIEQNNDERNHHVNESATGDFSDNHQVVSDIDAMNVIYPRQSTKNRLSKELKGLATSKRISHVNTSYSLAAEDLTTLSNEILLHSAWKHQLQMILEQSLAYHAGLRTTLPLKPQIYQGEIDQKLSSMYLLSNEIIQRQRIFQDFLSMLHSTRFSYERQQDSEISTHNDCMITGIFPVKLHRILLKLDQDRGGRDIAHFVPNGKAFVILNPHRFESEVMKEYFPRMSSYASFQKQLNLYDFRRSEKAYYHPSFLREFPSKCIGMKRNTMKKKPKFQC
jgi:hypothetical protein